MIDVDNLYQLVKDLSRKDLQGGYTSNVEFNRSVNFAQEILFEYYYSHPNESEGRHALNAFEEAVSLSRDAANRYAKPVDYKKKMDAAIALTGDSASAVTNCSSSSSAVANQWPVHFPARDELQMTLTSVIRGPSLAKGVFIGDTLPSFFRVYPEDATGTLELRYYRLLDQANRAVTINVTTQEEDYDAGSSTQLLWDEEHIQDFVDVLLLMKGVKMRDSALIQWVQSHNIIEPILTGVQ